VSEEEPSEAAEPCIHQWEIVVQTVAPSQPYHTWPTGSIPTDIVREFAQGVTRTLLKCDWCGEIRRELIYGVPRK
jgi:hypothetical protein